MLNVKNVIKLLSESFTNIPDSEITQLEHAVADELEVLLRQLQASGANELKSSYITLDFCDDVEDDISCAFEQLDLNKVYGFEQDNNNNDEGKHNINHDFDQIPFEYKQKAVAYWRNADANEGIVKKARKFTSVRSKFKKLKR